MINRATWNWCIAAMWFVLPALALRYWQVWDLLPLRLATHFDVGGRPNGWMTREGSMLFVICLCAIIVVPGSFILSRVRKPQLFSGALLAWFCVVLGVIFYGNESILTYNLYRQPVKLGPIIIVVMMAVAGLAVVLLLTHRGTVLPPAAVMSEEVHSRRVGVLLFAVPLLVEFIVLITVSNTVVRIAMAASIAVLAGAAAVMWHGFHYVFTRAGLEIRLLGFRLRSIPKASIREYRMDRWNVLGGYGIRGIGDRRAYVFGNKGVWITTSDGQVFLGHDHPEMLIRDLDAMQSSSGSVRS